jgi:hypothetical protein
MKVSTGMGRSGSFISDLSIFIPTILSVSIIWQWMDLGITLISSPKDQDQYEGYCGSPINKISGEFHGAWDFDIY